MKSLIDQIKDLPQSPGVYKFYDEEGELLYVGKSVDIKKRVASYFQTKDLGPKTERLVSKIYEIRHIKVFSEFEALLLESNLIRNYKPFFNVIAKDDKSPLYIKITGGQYPIVSVTRKTEITGKEFVKGPFPSSRVTKRILAHIRKIFPFCHHKNPKKPCLYVHLGMCPYPFLSDESAKAYKKTISKIKSILNGKIDKVTGDLTRQMQSLAKEQKFEEANVIKQKIISLQHLTAEYYDPNEFLKSPNLVDDTITKRLMELKDALCLSDLPLRIECYDISNISGKNATGSMVVFSNGVSDKTQYRHFRIRFLDTPNDFLMMRQVLLRRFKNDWPHPDLIIIDGGKGQLGIGVDVLKKLELKIPIVGLAKRFEEIYKAGESEPIRLGHESPARQLVQSIRDEAHRFAITYHRKLRSKKLMESLR